MSRLNGGQRGDGRAGHQDLARRRRLEAGDHPERRRLARARRAEQREELARGDVQRQAVHRGEVAEPLGQVAELEDRQAIRLVAPVSLSRSSDDGWEVDMAPGEEGDAVGETSPPTAE